MSGFIEGESRYQATLFPQALDEYIQQDNKVRVLDSSPFDREMRRFHNYMKDTPAFQQQSDGHQEFRFPPFSSWMVFTDTVSQACLSGQFAFVHTSIVHLGSCRLPELAPIIVMRQAAMAG